MSVSNGAELTIANVTIHNAPSWHLAFHDVARVDLHTGVGPAVNSGTQTNSALRVHKHVNIKKRKYNSKFLKLCIYCEKERTQNKKFPCEKTASHLNLISPLC